jgi:hypothetical protein
MAFFDQRAFIGRPSLRRSLETLEDDRRDAFMGQVGDLDPKRYKSLYRRRATNFLADERAGRAAMSSLYRDREEQRKRDLHRIQNFGRSPDEILGDF